MACKTSQKTIIVPFEVSDAYYFSWVIDENQKGTTIEIELKEVSDNVRFDSLIFRNVLLPVRISQENDNRKTITAILPSGDSKIPVKTKHVAKPDQLIFQYKGETRVQLLKNISRRDMIYY